MQKKIMIFIDWFLPGYKAGGPVRSVANMVEQLNDKFEFYIVTRDTEYLENTPYINVVSNQWNAFSHNVKVYYTGNNKLSLKLWRTLLREIKPEIVYINGIYSKYFSIYPLIAAKREKSEKIIVAPRGMLGKSAINVKGLKKKVFLFFSKVICLYNNNEWHATNDKEKDDILTITYRKLQITIAANLPRKTDTKPLPIEKNFKNLRLCIIARIAPEKNTLFALNCLKNCSSSKSTIEVDLFGQIYNENYWQKCKNMIAQLPENIKVRYCDVIDTEKIADTIGKYHALFLPTTGENFGHAILESFMAGRPVIISNQTPWKNLNEKNAGWDLPLFEENFIDAIKQISDMKQFDYDLLCKGSFDLANKYLTDKSLLEKYREMF